MAEQLYFSYEKVYDYYDQAGVYAYNGPDIEADSNKICKRAQKPTGFGQPFSVKAQQHLQ